MSERSRVALASLALFIVWIVYGRLAPGTFNDDDIVHYFLARRSLVEPEYFLSLWGRPLHTLLYALPARIGYGAVEALTAALTAGSVFLTWLVARQLDIRSRALVVVAAAFQPFVFKMGYSCLVEPLGAFLVVATLALVGTRRFWLAAITVGLLPLSRFELVALMPVFAWLIVRGVGVKGLVPMGLGLAAWSIGGTIADGDPVWLWTQLTGGHFTRSFDGARPLVHYARSLPMVTGGALFALVVVGLSRPEARIGGAVPFGAVRWMFALLLGLLSFLAWDAHEFGGSVGYLRHLVAAGPLIALLAGAGADRWRGDRDRASVSIVVVATLAVVAMAVTNVHHTVWEHPVNRAVEPWVWPATAVAALAALVWWARTPDATLPALALIAAVIGGSVVAEPPVMLDGERQALRNADRWIRLHAPGRRVAVNHPWFFFLGERDRFDRVRYPNLDHETLRTLAPGALVVWEDHYGPRLSGDVPIEYFAEHPERFRPRHKEFVSHQFKLIVFEVVDG